MIRQVCERTDHPADPHFHYGYGARYWSRVFPHWDVDATTQVWHKPPPEVVVLPHPDFPTEDG